MKSVTRIPFSALLLGCLFLTGCYSPIPVARLVPLSVNNTWQHGNQMATAAENDGVVVNATYQKSVDEELILNVQVINNSDEAILVDPKFFYYQPLNQDTMAPMEATYAAINPESKLMQLDIERSRLIAKSKNEELYESIGSTQDLMTSIGSLTGNFSEDEAAKYKEKSRQRQAEYKQEQLLNQSKMSSVTTTRQMLATSALRKTTVNPGSEAQGLVYFPRFDEAPLMKFNYRVAARDFEVIFEQKLIKP